MGAMTIRRSLLCLPLILAACSPSKKEEQTGANGYVRIAIPTEPAAQETAPAQPEGGQWRAGAGGGIEFGVPGQPAMFAVSCTHGSDGSARLHFVRRTRAEEGARALMAIEGNLHVARIPMDVTKPGDPGEWQGELDAHKETAGAIKGGFSMVATLPGGGAIKMPPTSEGGRLLDACRASSKSS